MGRFLQGWALACALLLAVVTASGFLVPAPFDADLHMLLGYVGTIAVLFSHTISMFYFIGTGSAVKKAATELAARGDRSMVPLWEQTKAFKNGLFPIQMMAMLVVMAASILGAAALTGALPAWVHLALELGAVPVNLVALLRTSKLVGENMVLMDAANLIYDRALAE